MIAGVLGPYWFLIVNGFIIQILLILNTAYANQLIPGWQELWGANPNWVVILPETMSAFWLLYPQSFILFTVLALPFILASSFTGHAIREMMGWNFPK